MPYNHAVSLFWQAAGLTFAKSLARASATFWEWKGHTFLLFLAMAPGRCFKLLQYWWMLRFLVDGRQAMKWVACFDEAGNGGRRKIGPDGGSGRGWGCALLPKWVLKALGWALQFL